MHITSLFGGFSIGSFGNKARRFADFLHECGFSYWQVLPFCMIDESNSPYKSYSAFGGNPYFIELPTLYNKNIKFRRYQPAFVPICADALAAEWRLLWSQSNK